MIFTTKFEETYTKDKKKETRTIVVEIDSEKEVPIVKKDT